MNFARDAVPGLAGTRNAVGQVAILLMALALGDNRPAIIAVNPGSMLGSKMVKEGFGVDGGDISIGAEILTRAALSEEFATASGQYFDNDSGKFAAPHRDALDAQKCEAIVGVIETLASADLSAVEES